MRENDIAIEPGVLATVRHKLGRILNELEQFAAQLGHNMTIVSKNFNSSNFENADRVVRATISKLRQASESLRRGFKFLDELEVKAENYLKCGYRG